jgi:hypothetical protein
MEPFDIHASPLDKHIHIAANDSSFGSGSDTRLDTHARVVPNRAVHSSLQSPGPPESSRIGGSSSTDSGSERRVHQDGGMRIAGGPPILPTASSSRDIPPAYGQVQYF